MLLDVVKTMMAQKDQEAPKSPALGQDGFNGRLLDERHFRRVPTFDGKMAC